ncbi:mersacidin family lantibiotic [Enterococcus sp. LJL99]
MNKQAEKKVGKSFEELTTEEMNKVQGSCRKSCCAPSWNYYSSRCSYNCYSSRCSCWW